MNFQIVMQKVIKIDEKKCDECGRYVDTCPEETIKYSTAEQI